MTGLDAFRAAESQRTSDAPDATTVAVGRACEPELKHSHRIAHHCAALTQCEMHSLRFDNSFVQDLPGDPEAGARLRQVEGALWSSVSPTPVLAPRLVAHSREMVERLGLDASDAPGRPDRTPSPWIGHMPG